MRRSLAISLLLVFSVGLIAPLFASSAAEASVPMCCRRNGSHHCSALSEAGSQSGAAVAVIGQKCPYAPSAPAVLHLSVLAPHTQHAVFAGLISHPAVHAQVAAQYRISFDRSRQKRGPPSLTLL